MRVIGGVKYLTIQEIIEAGRGSDSTIRRKIKSGDIKAQKDIDGKIIISETELERYVKKHQVAS